MASLSLPHFRDGSGEAPEHPASEATLGVLPWVFPDDGANGHMTTIRTFWSAVCRRAGIEGVRDVRHTSPACSYHREKACR
jgi:hypothetical protein